MTHSAESLSSQLASFLNQRAPYPADFAASIVDSFATITRPKINVSRTGTISYITALKPSAGGTTVKPGNIRLNWKKLFEKAPELVLTGAGVTQTWLIPFAVLYLWNLVWSLSKIEITPIQAMTMYALWNVEPPTRRFEEGDALAYVNAYRSRCGASALSERDFAAVIDELTRLGCVELSDGEVWLREWIKKTN